MAYDMALLKIRGSDADTNFPSNEVEDEMRRLKVENLYVDELIVMLRKEARKNED